MVPCHADIIVTRLKRTFGNDTSVLNCWHGHYPWYRRVMFHRHVLGAVLALTHQWHHEDFMETIGVWIDHQVILLRYRPHICSVFVRHFLHICTRARVCDLHCVAQSYNERISSNWLWLKHSSECSDPFWVWNHGQDWRPLIFWCFYTSINLPKPYLKLVSYKK